MRRSNQGPTFAGRCLLLLLVVIGASTGVLAQKIPGFPPLEVKVPAPPTPMPAGGGTYLCYELHLTNYYAEPITVEGVEVIADTEGGAVLATYRGQELIDNMRRPGTADEPSERPAIDGGMLAFVYFFIRIEDGQPAPGRLLHRISFTKTVEGGSEPGVIQSFSPVRAEGPVEVGPPLLGGIWVAKHGPSNSSGHRRMVRPLVGPATVTQRYAIDYVKIDEQGKQFSGDPKINANHLCYGEEIIAVADGVVAMTTTGIADNVPGRTLDEISATRMVGNSVMVDIGGGVYVYYAQFKPGSIVVKPGDRVKRGQLLGLLGNSGNSMGPHLHIHFESAPVPLSSEGLPYVIDAYERVGMCEGRNCTIGPAQEVSGEIPLRDEIVVFPE